MVVALGPGKFYGSSLPRPRFFTDVKLNDERVDPPVPVMDPLLSWANEAHWSMGGLSFQRHRLQGRIEGSIKKLRAQRDRSSQRRKKKSTDSSGKPISMKSLNWESSDEESEEEIVEASPSPPPRKKAVRKLVDEFEKVAAEEAKRRKSIVDGDIAADVASSRSRSRRSPAGRKEAAACGFAGAGVRRISPRKAKSPSVR
ncbi:hypothetical protein AXF42_Ash006436 [Apostasia shenzhenica]|uniref:Uncharacterized protein n=1 Tax=Apostasia shenzhenica TaxID=1088818 RepID=A0A2I0AZ28_9ASPA|nr:hypothetical protein AXF42_Ash006436 [Apostasia shenzhenica]